MIFPSTCLTSQQKCSQALMLIAFWVVKVYCYEHLLLQLSPSHLPPAAFCLLAHLELTEEAKHSPTVKIDDRKAKSSFWDVGSWTNFLQVEIAVKYLWKFSCKYDFIAMFNRCLLRFFFQATPLFCRLFGFQILSVAHIALYSALKIPV